MSERLTVTSGPKCLSFLCDRPHISQVFSWILFSFSLAFFGAMMQNCFHKMKINIRIYDSGGQNAKLKRVRRDFRQIIANINFASHSLDDIIYSSWSKIHSFTATQFRNRRKFAFGFYIYINTCVMCKRFEIICSAQLYQNTKFAYTFVQWINKMRNRNKFICHLLYTYNLTDTFHLRE